MTQWLVTGPLAVLELSTLALAAARPDLAPWLRLAWLALSWTYAAYWLVPLQF